MYKVIIADDESRVRSAVNKLGDWKAIGLDIAAEAQDGDELCELVDSHRPDIIITDLKMPGLSGAELIKKLGDEYREMKIIIISGFDDFEYAKQAISSKVVDYILKPIDEDSLNNALRKAVWDIEAEKQKAMENTSLKSRLDEALPYLKEKLFNKFVHGQDISEEEFFNLADIPDVKKEAGTYTVAVVVIENYLQLCAEVYKGNAQAFLFAVTNAINELLAGRNTVSFRNDRNENEIIIIFCGDENKESLFLVLEEIIDKLNELLKVRIFAGIGLKYSSFRDVKHSLDEARTVLMQINIIEYGRVVFYEDIADYTIKGVKNLAKNESSFLVAIENGNIALLRCAIEELYSDVAKAKYICIADIKKLNYDIVSLLEGLIENADAKSKFLEEIFRLRQKVELELDIDMIKRTMLAFIESVTTFISIKKRKNENGTIYKIHKHIEENFTTKLTLSDLAHKFYWSEEYISKMFKEEFGMNLFEFIASLKIERAKELLVKGLKIHEICDLLGFTDESHFSRAFKKNTGMSPKSFRDSFQ